MITIEKDDFTGLKTINSAFYGLEAFMSFNGPSDIYVRYMRDKTGISDAFDLLYLETENGQGNVCIRVCSSVAKFSGNQEWPHWMDEWPIIIDGERLSLSSTSTNSFENDYELKVYNLTIDIFSKICNAKEVKFSLRGRNKKIEGVFTTPYITLFKAFEQYCFGDENEGKKLLKSVGPITYSCYSCKSDNIVPISWDSFNCHNCKKNNVIIRPKELTDEEKTYHENAVLELVREMKIKEAIQYYAENFGYTEKDSNIKVKDLGNKSGLDLDKLLNEQKRKENEEKESKAEFIVIDLIKKDHIHDGIKYYVNNLRYTEEKAKLKVKELAEKNGCNNTFIKYEESQKANISKKTKIAISVFGSLLVLIIVTIAAYFIVNKPEESDDKITPNNMSVNQQENEKQIVVKDNNPKEPEITSDITNKNLNSIDFKNALVGSWSGEMGGKRLTLVINEIIDNKVKGYNITGNNKRDLDGTFERVNTDIPCTHSYKFILTEPGDDKWDGIFSINFVLHEAEKEGTTGLECGGGIDLIESEGTWKANNGKLEHDFILKKL